MTISKKVILLLLLSLTLFSCASRAPVIEIESPVEIPAPLAPPMIEVPDETYLTIVAVGDNIIHDPVLRASFDGKAYSFDSIYDNIRYYIKAADIAFVNQETVLGNEKTGYSGYPLFSTPREAGAALAAAGFNVVNHATNHAMDKGEAGILSTMDYWDSQGAVRYLGIHRSEEDRKSRHAIISKNNIKVGFLAYTYGTNGIALPKDKSYLVSLIEREKMAAEIDALRPFCDYLVVSMHWGEEYRMEYNESQMRLATLLAEHQVDLVIGHHPHVLEPFVIISRPDGGSMPVFYSLGNFLSAHARPFKEVLLGGLAYVKLKKSGEKTSVEEIGLIPVITHYEANHTSFSIYPLHDYSEELAEKHWRRINDNDTTLNFFNEKAQEIFGPVLILENPFAF